ncbi:MAG: hypothetical protein JWO87_2204, partial [Phycisphaerales bacterium]|nr:hypothetical protein [Phycisphaerales bacterium]
MWPKFCTWVLEACSVALTIALARDGREASVAS